MSALGTLAITGRSNGTRWYARIAMSGDLVADCGWNGGTRLIVLREEDKLCIRQSDLGRFSLPKANGIRAVRHAFEVSIKKLGLPAKPFAQTAVSIQRIDDTVVIELPKCMHKNWESTTEDENVDTSNLKEANSAEDSSKTGKQVDLSEIGEIVSFLIENDILIEKLSPRLWRVGKEVENGAGVMDIANRIRDRKGLPRFTLVI